MGTLNLLRIATKVTFTTVTKFMLIKCVHYCIKCPVIIATVEVFAEFKELSIWQTPL